MKPRRETKSGYLRDSIARDLVGAIGKVAPGSEKSASIFLKALRRPDIRSIVGGKNSFYMRNLLWKSWHGENQRTPRP